jgi:hypothetical protein
MFESNRNQIETVEVLGAMIKVSKITLRQASVDIKKQVKRELYSRLMEEFTKYLEENVAKDIHHKFALFNIQFEEVDLDERARRNGTSINPFYYGEGEMEFRVRARIGLVYGGY